MTENYFPVIPEAIRVHLGAPNEAAPNVTVPFPDYIKNVASSEIYPTWPENALRANILAEVSFALNRVYTEYYRSRGYDFDITNSTASDQAYVEGRDIFENVSILVDELFNQYITREGSVEPLYAQYCNGSTVYCEGLSQWGSVTLAEGGATPYQILIYYYGSNINIIRDVAVVGVMESYPGQILRLGSVNNDVLRMQIRLNRISKNFPAIPKISSPGGVFGQETEAAVLKFQEIFSLVPDGLVGPATWYEIVKMYASVKRLSDLHSEGIPFGDLVNAFQTTLRRGSTGTEVMEAQYLLSFIGNFVDTVPTLALDGIFGPLTEAATEAFQATYRLPVTGVIDRSTWEKLYAAYRGMLDSLPDDYFDSGTRPYPGMPLREGSSGADVIALQTYLNFIADTYPAIPKTVPDGFFGPGTTAAVRAFQRLFGRVVTGIVASTTWNAITELYRTLADGSAS